MAHHHDHHHHHPDDAHQPIEWKGEAGHYEVMAEAMRQLLIEKGVVTAEGVETLEQARALEASGCALQQGYYFSRPVPAQEIASLLARRWELPPLRGAAGNAFADTLVIVD